MPPIKKDFGPALEGPDSCEQGPGSLIPLCDLTELSSGCV